MQLTQTSEISEFKAPLPDAVSLWFDSDKPNHTQGVFPARSTFTTGRHWHYDYAETFKVHQGAILVTIHNKSMVVTSNDGVTVIPVTARHELMRWDRPGLKGHQKVAQDAFKRSKSKDELRQLADEDARLEEYVVFFAVLLPVAFMSKVFERCEGQKELYCTVLTQVHALLDGQAQKMDSRNFSFAN